MIGRALVWVFAAIFVFFGVTYLVSPAPLTLSAGVSADASGLTDIRVNYGGVQLGIGLFLAWCALSRVSTGLLLTAVVMGAILLGRVTGFVVDGSVTSFHLSALTVEVPMATLALWFDWRSRDA